MFEHGLAFWGIIPLLGTIFWTVLLIGLAYTLLRGLTGRNTHFIGYQPAPTPPPFQPAPPPYQPSALEILRQRYARGEIDDVTYQQMRERLEASTIPPQTQQF